MLSKSSLRLTGTVEARDDLASSVDHLGLYVRPETRERIVKDRRGPRRVEGWPLDFMPGNYRLVSMSLNAFGVQPLDTDERFPVFP